MTHPRRGFRIAALFDERSRGTLAHPAAECVVPDEKPAVLPLEHLDERLLVEQGEGGRAHVGLEVEPCARRQGDVLRGRGTRAEKQQPGEEDGERA